MTLNKDLYQKDPTQYALANNGVAALSGSQSDHERSALRFELETFVCDGQYHEGLRRILDGFLTNLKTATQPPVWVNGYYGSGKSHLLKMFWHLWMNTAFPDGNTARGLARLPDDVRTLLRELDSEAKRQGGLHAAAGQLSDLGGVGTLASALGVIFGSKGLPTDLPSARFCLWLKEEKLFDSFQSAVEQAGKNFKDEIRHLYMSPVIADALLKVLPGFAPDEKSVRMLIRQQFPVEPQIGVEAFVRDCRRALSDGGKLPLTAIILDEVQLYIDGKSERSKEIQDMAEAISKRMDSKVLLIAAGQTALAAGDQLLSRLAGRFTQQITLSDKDVATVTRQVVLQKRPDRRGELDGILSRCSGEIERQLAGTIFRSRSEDRALLADDYPLLPARRRFWEAALRAVDAPGTASQLRSQLRMVFESARLTAGKSVGHVIPADFLFEQQQDVLLSAQMLLRVHHETIAGLDDGSEEGRLKRRICGLIWLIRKLPREGHADTGLRASAPMLADLLVSDLTEEGPRLRQQVPRLLEAMVANGVLLKLDEEYLLQTREGLEWESVFAGCFQKLMSNPLRLIASAQSLIQTGIARDYGRNTQPQGKTRTPRRVQWHSGGDVPKSREGEIPVWVRDHWSVTPQQFKGDAIALGAGSPVVCVYVERKDKEQLEKAMLTAQAAHDTLELRGQPSTKEGEESRQAMQSRQREAERRRDEIIAAMLQDSTVMLAGGEELQGLGLKEKVERAAQAALMRLYPRFDEGDEKGWDTVLGRARNGDENALRVVGHEDKAERHPVCAELLRMMGGGKTGREVRDHFEGPPFGWPRDTVDAALLALTATGKLRASLRGQTVSVRDLDQGKIPGAEFRVESFSLGAADRIVIKKLFQGLDVSVRSGEEENQLPAFVNKVRELLTEVQGPAPLPLRHSLPWMENLEGLTGLERLRLLLDRHVEVQSTLDALKETVARARIRSKAWKRACALREYLSDIAPAKPLLAQMQAMEADRSLLSGEDAITPIARDLFAQARAALTGAQGEYETELARVRKDLEADPIWKSLSPPARETILSDTGIAAQILPPLGDEDAVLAALSQRTPGTWLILREALPHKAANALARAAQLSEPKARRVNLPKVTLRDEAELKAWLTSTETHLRDALQNGPVILL